VLYQAFNRREVGVLLLDTRAGSPPSGPELLHRMGSAGVASSLHGLFAEWERWVADVLESHMSYPILTLFRSPHDNTSWVTSLGSVLDAATLLLTAVEDEPDERAILLYGTGVHAVEDLFYYFRLTERETVIQRDEFEDVLGDMKDDGFAVRPLDDAFARFTKKRAKYAPRLDALAVLLAATPTLWIGDRSFLGARTEHCPAAGLPGRCRPRAAFGDHRASRGHRHELAVGVLDPSRRDRDRPPTLLDGRPSEQVTPVRRDGAEEVHLQVERAERGPGRQRCRHRRVDRRVRERREHPTVEHAEARAEPQRRGHRERHAPLGDLNEPEAQQEAVR
jgi:hypothetical protein